MKTKNRPNISAALLWEFDLESFNFDKSAKIVIERVLQFGDLAEWKEIVSFYKKELIVETIEWSKQLEERDKGFSKFFLESDFVK